MLHAFDADQGIRDFLDLRAFAFHDQHFEAVVVIEVDVHPCQDMALEIMLDMSELPREIAHVMVVHERNGCDGLLVGLSGPFLADELIADEIAERFRSRGILTTPDNLIEVVKQVMIQRYAETDELLHRRSATFIIFVARL